MKRMITICAAALCLTMALAPAAMAADPASSQPEVCYPSAITRSEDGTELRKLYDLGPEDDPAGIPRSDFEQDGFHYTLTDLLQQELPEYEERAHTETVTLESEKKDMESVLALLPQEREFITEDGFTGTLSLQLDTVQVEVAGYGSSTREVSATRSYPNLLSQDTQYIPKTVEEDGRTLTLQSIDWQTDNTATADGYAMGDRFTAIATYTEDLLIGNPDISAFLCLNDNTALTCYGTCAQMGKEDCMVIGFDGSPAGKQSIADGQMTGTMVYSPVDLAKTSFEAAQKLYNGEDVDKETQVEMWLISPENVNEYALDAWT